MNENYLSLFIYLTVYGLASLLFSFGVKRKSNIFVWSAVLILGVFAGIRDNVGTDQLNYIGYFNNFAKSSVGELLNSTEFGFGLLGKLASVFGGKEVFFTFCALIVLLPVMFSLKNNYKNISISTAMFFFAMVPFTESFNAMRQMIAGSFLFVGFTYIFSGEFIKYIFMVSVAMTFHNSAIIAIPLYFLWNRKQNKVLIDFKFVVLVCLAIFVLFNLKSSYALLADVSSSVGKYANYLNKEGGNLGRGFIFYMSELAIFLCFYKRLVKLDSRNSFFIALCIFGSVITLGSLMVPYFNRLTHYFYFGTFVLISQMFKCFKSKTLAKASVIFAGCVGFWLLYLVMGASMIIPYRVVDFGLF